MTTSPSLVGDSLVSQYGALICDLDGVVYRGAHAVPGAVQTLRSTLASDRPVVFATNNASREPRVVEGHLASLGVDHGSWSVVSSAQAAATYVAGRVGAGTAVMAVGGPGVAQALRDVDLRPFAAASGRRSAPAAAVVQGAGTNVNWRDLAETAHQVRSGAMWVATNPDRTIPTRRGLAPGNGALVAAVQCALDAVPIVVGKPEPLLYELAMHRLTTAVRDVLVVGDRLDTDIAAAHAAGMDSLLVLSGVHGIRDVVFCPPEKRPTYVDVDLAGLLATARRRDPHLESLALAIADLDLALFQVGHGLTSMVEGLWRALDAGREVSRDPERWNALDTWVRSKHTAPERH